jgi:hypothetical protein
MRDDMNQGREPQGRKGPYQPPQLMEYGTVAALTRGAFSTMQDADKTMTEQMKMNP